MLFNLGDCNIPQVKFAPNDVLSFFIKNFTGESDLSLTKVNQLYITWVMNHILLVGTLNFQLRLSPVTVESLMHPTFYLS